MGKDAPDMFKNCTSHLVKPSMYDINKDFKKNDNVKKVK